MATVLEIRKHGKIREDMEKSGKMKRVRIVREFEKKGGKSGDFDKLS